MPSHSQTSLCELREIYITSRIPFHVSVSSHHQQQLSFLRTNFNSIIWTSQLHFTLREFLTSNHQPKYASFHYFLASYKPNRQVDLCYTISYLSISYFQNIKRISKWVAVATTKLWPSFRSDYSHQVRKQFSNKIYNNNPTKHHATNHNVSSGRERRWSRWLQCASPVISPYIYSFQLPFREWSTVLIQHSRARTSLYWLWWSNFSFSHAIPNYDTTGFVFDKHNYGSHDILMISNMTAFKRAFTQMIAFKRGVGG